MTESDAEILTDPPFSGLTFADFKFADSVRWTLKGILYEGWVMGINKKSIAVETEEIEPYRIYGHRFYIHPSKLFKGHITSV